MPSKFDYAGYWDKKLEYFRQTEDLTNARSDVPKGDVIGELIDLLNIQKGDLLLDLGCGYGRLFQFYLQRGALIYGVDVSPRMLAEAEKEYINNPDVHLFNMNVEKLNFDNSLFNIIICYGVFDALECHYEALEEMSRVCKPNGRVLISGKHKPYHNDDEEARIAESKAAEVNHPNFFINWGEFERELMKNDLKIAHPFFYERRGDSAENRYLTKTPSVFYDFNLILEKI